MTVYVVWLSGGHYEAPEMGGIFSTRDKAEAFGARATAAPRSEGWVTPYRAVVEAVGVDPA